MNKEFQHWTLDEKQVVKADRIAAAFDRLLVELTTPGHYPDDTTVLVPPCRETSIMRTKLEEAFFFAKKAMASNPAQVEIKMPELLVPPPPPPPTDTPPSSPQS